MDQHLNDTYDEQAVLTAVAQALTEFYTNLTAKLDGVDVDKVLKRKNPYLYRAKGISDAHTIVEGILSAYVSSSEETIFGNVFFEPLAIALSGGQKAVTEGVDITVDKDNTIYSIAVKSGTSVFNADSRKRQEQNFLSAQKAFVPVVGYGYGRKKIKPGSEKFYMEIAGQDFWEWLTGDAGFYIKIVELMGTRPDEYAQEFKTAYDRALNRMTRDFTIRFCNEDGSVKWDELLKFNSGSM